MSAISDGNLSHCGEEEADTSGLQEKIPAERLPAEKLPAEKPQQKKKTNSVRNAISKFHTQREAIPRINDSRTKELPTDLQLCFWRSYV